MEHVHEPSDDSYCTTDEGNSRKEEGEEPYTPIEDDKIGEEIKVKEDKAILHFLLWSRLNNRLKKGTEW